MKITRRLFAQSSLLLPAIPVTRTAAQTPADDDLQPASVRFRQNLSLLPADLFGDDVTIAWADLERQRSMYPDWTAEDVRTAMPFTEATWFLSYMHLMKPELGFDDLDVVQAIHMGTPPSSITVLKLSVDTTTLPDSWVAVGYEEKQATWGTYWTLGENGELDLTNPVSQRFLAKANNIVLIDNTMIVMASTLAEAEAVISTVSGTSDDLSDAFDGWIDAIPDDSICAWALPGSLLGVPPLGGNEVLAESDDAVGPMPVVSQIAVGQVAGTSSFEDWQRGSGESWLVLQVDGQGAASQAAAVIEWRIANLTSAVSRQPFIDVLPDLVLETEGDGLVILRVAGSAGHQFFFQRMILAGDIAPIAYIAE